MDRVVIASNTQEVAAKYAEYFRYNLEDIRVLAMNKSRSMAISLWMYTPKAKPSDISSKVKSLGWRVIRPGNQKMQELIAKFDGGRAGVRIGRRMGFKPVSLKDMQRVITGLRIRQVGGLAGGWLHAARQAGGKARGKAGKGWVRVYKDGGVITVIIANSMPGIIALQSKHQFVEKAFQREIDDMDVYIERKRIERASIFNPSGRRLKQAA